MIVTTLFTMVLFHFINQISALSYLTPPQNCYANQTNFFCEIDDYYLCSNNTKLELNFVTIGIVKLLHVI